MFRPILIILSLLFLQCTGQNHKIEESLETKKVRQDSIIEKYVTNCAKTYNYTFQMPEWQDCLDKGLMIDSTVAYLWQQKAMPYFKAKKYEVGMEYLDKAVKYDPKSWLSYRAFIKCIFVKNYKDAIKDFELCLQMDGNTYVQDHTYQFYIALSYLQLNEFEKAENIFQKDIATQEEKWNEVHFIDLFYYGISKYEQGKWEEAIVEFDKSLEQYPGFSDAEYYKSNCLWRLNRYEESESLYDKAKMDAAMYRTISESNAIYETYPYQVRW